MNAITINQDGSTQEIHISDSTKLGEYVIYLKERYGKVEISSNEKYKFVFKILS